MRRSSSRVAAWVLMVAVALLGGASVAHAQRIVVVYVALTDDPRIGNDCQIDLFNIQGLFARYPDLARVTQFIPIAGARANSTTIINQLNALQVGPADAVMFYYSGHGAEDPNTHEHWCALPDNQPLLVSQVSRIIAQKHPRLNVVVADMCSVLQRPKPAPAPGGAGMPAPPPGIPPAYASLFLESQGTVILISSSTNQVAVGDVNRVEGGIFTAAFARFLRDNEQRRLTWQELFRGASLLTHQKFVLDNPRGISERDVGNPGFPLQTTQTPHAVTLNVSRMAGAGGVAPGAAPVAPQKLAFGAYVLNNNGDGVMIQQVADGSPAQLNGLEPRDVILEINGTPVRSTAEYQQAVAASPPDMQFLLRNWRDNRVYRYNIRLNR